MGFKCGIVGLPNVGKSTLFNALTNAAIEAANYPFCTIEPNVGVVPIPDPRLHQLATLANSKEVIPAVMQFVDIAGLVKGASKGEGLGNKFLANISTAFLCVTFPIRLPVSARLALKRVLSWPWNSSKSTWYACTQFRTTDGWPTSFRSIC